MSGKIPLIKNVTWKQTDLRSSCRGAAGCSLCKTPLNRSQSDCWLTDKEDRSVYVSQECDVQMLRLMVLLICIYTCMRVCTYSTHWFLEVSEPLFDLLPDFLVFWTDTVAICDLCKWNYRCSPTCIPSRYHYWHSRPRTDRLTGRLMQ